MEESFSTSTPATLLAAVLEPSNLFTAWEKVRSNDGMPGVDGQTIAIFEHNVFGRLLTLKHQVEKNEYRPQPLMEVFIPKPDGGERRLAVPAVRDRVLQTAVTRIIAPILDRGFEDASFAYRAGRSVAMAVARVAYYRDQGYHWVVDADIQTFFDEIDHRILIGKLRQALPDASLIHLIELWLAAVLQPADGPPVLLTKGVPQGSPISPLLSNLYLDSFDEALVAQDMRLVRFADDFLILCKHREQAQQAMDLTEDLLETLKLALKPEKTRITHFEEGFRFLGVDFIRNLLRPADENSAPWVMPDTEDHQRAIPEPEDDDASADMAARQEEGNSSETPAAELEPEHTPKAGHTADNIETYISPRALLPEPLLRASENDTAHDEHIRLEEGPPLEPLMRGLIITGAGHHLLKDGERIAVARDREHLVSIPLHKIDYVMVHGNQLVSTALFRHSADTGLTWVFADGLGRIQASLHLHREGGLDLVRQQFAREKDAAFQLMLARAMVTGKINNQRIQLARLNRSRNLEGIAQAMEAMAKLTEGLPHTPSLEHVRGIEGQAARHYFSALRHILPEHWNFQGRRKQPPEDPFNVLLSYGYGLLFTTVRTLVERRGLYPYLGSLHAANGRHHALVSDLMEEFRAPIVDQTAIQMALTKLKPEDFIWDADAELPCRLSENARKAYLHALQQRLRQHSVHPRARQKMDGHRLIHYQIHHYARVIMGEDPVYHPYMIR